MQCQKCGRVVRPNNTTGRNESLTERRYYCSCGFVNKSYETVVMTWRKTEYKPREAAQPKQTEAPPSAVEDAPAQAKTRKRRARK